MVVILRNEVLGACGKKVIYKTYDTEKDHYGLYKETPDGTTSLSENYIHIFPFKDNKAAAITEDEDYVWISPNLEEIPMEEEDKWFCEAMVILDSVCNCVTIDTCIDCDLCALGVIPNNYRFRRVDEQSGLVVYEYHTNCYTYRIKVYEGDSFMSRVVDYVWDSSDIISRLKIIVETFETQKVKLEDNLYVCVLDSVCDVYPTTLLTPYFITIDIIDVVIIL
ncbi:hypothetical protein [Pontibacter sp. H249]|uniref:hypothetical protein n=1 Tax=Pontibacter sp. H249 TaxID=3133420 RepID=UPI0030BCFE62